MQAPFATRDFASWSTNFSCPTLAPQNTVHQRRLTLPKVTGTCHLSLLLYSSYRVSSCHLSTRIFWLSRLKRETNSHSSSSMDPQLRNHTFREIDRCVPPLIQWSWLYWDFTNQKSTTLDPNHWSLDSLNFDTRIHIRDQRYLLIWI
jgi:hypothetical protein